MANTAFAVPSVEFTALFSGLGRPSIPPERLLRAMLLQAFYSIRSGRQLMERLEFDLLFCWFVGLGVDDPAWDHSTFSKNRDRLLEGDIAAGSLSAVLAQPRASMDIEHARTIVFLRWAGFDDGDEVTGSGSAELNEDGTLEIELSFDNGDDAVLKARRA